MTNIHYNIEAAEVFLVDLQNRLEALNERTNDERHLFESVFDTWKDDRAKKFEHRLEDWTRGIEQCKADIEDLMLAVRQQIGMAREYLETVDRW